MYFCARASIARCYNFDIFNIYFYCNLIKGFPVPPKISVRFEIRNSQSSVSVFGWEHLLQLVNKAIILQMALCPQILLWNIFPCLDIIIIIMIKHVGSAQFDWGQLELFSLHYLMRCKGSDGASPYMLSGPVLPSSFHTRSSVSFCQNVYYHYVLNKAVDEQIIEIAEICTLRMPGV